MANPTKKQIRDRIVALATDAGASEDLKAFTDRLSENDAEIKSVTPASIKSRINTFLGQADAAIDLPRLQRAVMWCKDNLAEFSAPQLATLKARLAELETSGTASEGVNAYLEQLLDRYEDIGHDTATVLNRLRLELLKDAADINVNRLERLLGTAKEHWGELIDE